MKLTGAESTYDTSHFNILTSIREYFTLALSSKLGLKNMTLDEFHLLSNMSCNRYDNFNMTFAMKFLLHMSLFIEEYVHRARTETILNAIVDEMHEIDVDHQLIKLQAESSIEAFSTPTLINKANFQDTCFIQYTQEKAFEPYRNFRTVSASKLLLCEQLELDKEEFSIKLFKMEATVSAINKVLIFNQFYLMPKGVTRVCIDDLKELVDNPSKGIHVHPLKDALGIVTLVCTCLSLVCLLLTFCIYCLCSKLRTIPGCNNMCLIVSLFIAQASFQFGNNSFDNTMPCYIIGMITHVAWLSLFCWMNVCSFHMFRTFSFHNVVPNQSTNKLATMVRYSTYAFGLPIIVVGANAIITGYITGWISFGYGHVKCFVDDFVSFSVTFLAPVCLICLLNLIFFSITAYKIKQTPRVQSSQDKRHFDVYIRLFVITGVTWIFVIVESFLPISSLSFVTTVLNGCQGVYLFVSYVSNERAWKLIKENLSQCLVGRVHAKLKLRVLETSTTSSASSTQNSNK